MKEKTASEKKIYSFGFYNLENLFDVKDDIRKLDDDFTPNSEKNWTEKRFRKKIKKLGKVIASIGLETINHPPVILGVAEVENSYVLKQLIASKHLKSFDYSFIHFDSPDERGIDTALLYRSNYFSIVNKKNHAVYLTNEEGERDFTRDILHVEGILEAKPVHILVNHWPSRRAGSVETAYKRITAAKTNREIIKQITIKDPNARIVVMGDFNDDPNMESVTTLMGDDFYNPMQLLHTKYEGSLNYKGAWNLFDQIIISNTFFKSESNHFSFEKADIFNAKIVQEYTGKYKGNPFRTYVGKKYLGGYSDHFPVYATFSIKK